MRDRINRPEKKRLIESAEQFVLIKELRYTIAHDYGPVATKKIFLTVLASYPAVFDVVERVEKYVSVYQDRNN